MTAIELLNQLRELNFTISADDGRLIVRGPKEGLPPPLRAQLTERKSEILELLDAATVPRPAPLRRVPQDREFCLSFAQQRLWFLDQLEPGKSIYNVPGALRLKGPLAVDALQRSLEEIIGRHAALRTTFATAEAGPVQVVSPSSQFTLLREEIGCRTEEESEAEIRRRVASEGSRPFDLSRGPLLRAKLIRVAADDHVLLLTMHHIVSDGWSMSVLYRELSALYRAFLEGEASPLDELPIQYADFALWQREWLKGPELDRQLGYWKKKLDGIPALINLRTDRPRPAVQSFRGRTQSPVFGKDLLEALKALNRREGVTLFMTLLAAFQTLLYRYTGQEDIVVGAAIANRNRTEIEGLIGFFVNTLALRANFAGDPTFRDFLASVRRSALEAYEHQDLPFEKLVEELNPHRTLSYTPVFQVMLVLQNAPDSALKLEGLSVSRVRGVTETAKFDLTLSVSESAEGLRVSLQYNTDLFEDATIARLLAHFEVLLRCIVHDPTKRISELSLMTEAESRDLVERGKIKTRYEKARCLHDLFEEQARRAPQAVALVFGEQHWTYGELNASANALARTLRERGVGADVLVGLCVGRSPELIIGILAILKAGGAYVPLDPGYPKQRIEFMLEDSAISLIVTQERLAAGLPAGRFSTLFVDARELKDASFDSVNAELTDTATPDNLAYVIYTSGSTGKPKGVLITHHNVVRLFQSSESRFHFASSDVWTLFHSCAFDFSVWEIWGALLHGGKLIIVPSSISQAPDELAQLIEAQGVTVLNQTPSAFRQLMPHLLSVASPAGAALRYVIFGGEALELQSLRPWLERFGDQPPKLINMYGITETTVHVTYQPITSALVESTSASIIGAPLPDLSVYILDAQRRLLPMGVAGEIYVGGAGVARGYLKRPELTAERFIADPFSGDPKARLYRSGDLARWLPGGQLEYLGRIDDQVKIRGYRIELGEIEWVLRQHPGVREAVAVMRGSDAGERRVLAYVEAQKDAALVSSELRSFLKERLPEYMLPAAFVLVEKFPLTSNGKLDRNALPEPDPDQPASVYVAPRSSTEKLLAEIWARVLKVGRVGLRDNFFELGGHSLLAVQAVSRMREALKKDIPLRTLFEAPTIGELAPRIEPTAGSEDATQARPIERAARESYRIKRDK